MQGLAEALASAGWNGCTVGELLHPGQQRQDAICWAIARLLGSGKSVAEVWPVLGGLAAGGRPGAADAAGGPADQALLSEEERHAQRCQQLLVLLGVKTTVDDIRGCGESSNDLLLRLAELVGAVESQRGSDSAHRGSGASTALAPTAAQQLLDAACDAGPRLWCESTHLFPRDMAHLLDEYKDAGNLLPAALPGLQQRLSAGGCGKSERPFSGEAWSPAMEGMSAAVEDLTDAGARLADVFAEELRVWSEGGGGEAQTLGLLPQTSPWQQRQQQQQQQQQHGQGLPSQEGGAAPSDLGATACEALSGYQDLTRLTDALGLLMDMHATLQDVPCEWLTDLATDQSAAAAQLDDGAAILTSP